MSVGDAAALFDNLKLSGIEEEIGRKLLAELRSRLGFLLNLGLEYLTLDRSAVTLSGGEGQRVRLATQIGSALVGVLYILDEPSVGLHQRDSERLLRVLLDLRDRGNSVLLVEHDEQMIRSADYVVDLGAGSGEHGGGSCGGRQAGTTDRGAREALPANTSRGDDQSLYREHGEKGEEKSRSPMRHTIT